MENFECYLYVIILLLGIPHVAAATVVWDRNSGPVVLLWTILLLIAVVLS
jgi:hypothetical protein